MRLSNTGETSAMVLSMMHSPREAKVLCRCNTFTELSQIWEETMSNRHWEQLGAAAGIVFVVGQVAANNLMEQPGGSEPPFFAEAPEIVDFFMRLDSHLFGLGDYLMTLAVIPFVWWLSVLWARLHRAEGTAGWLSVATLGFGLVAATQLVSGGGWTLAMGRIEEGLDPQLARTLFDMGNLNFVDIWVSFAGMLIAASVLSIRTGALPKWLGWAGMVVALGLVIARGFWEQSGMVVFIYAFFWLWMIVTGVVLIRRAAVTGAA